MKQTMKRLLGFCLVIMMVLTFIPANVFAVADLQIVGDAKLFLPADGAIEVQYSAAQLDGTPITEGVTWSLVDDGRVKTYAKIDEATGKVTVNAVALGESFKVKAELASGDSVEFPVSIHNTSLSYDFEDGEMPAAFNQNGNNGTFAIAEQASGNKYANITTNSGWGLSSYLDLSGLGLKTGHLTVDAKYMTDGVSKSKGTHYPVQITWDKTIEGATDYKGTALTTHSYKLGLTAKNTEGNISLTRTKWDLTSQGTYLNKLYYPSESAVVNSTYAYVADEFVNVKLEVMGTDFRTTIAENEPVTVVNGENGYKFVGILNDSMVNYNVDKIYFGAPVDDLEIYTGTKVAAFTAEGTYPPVPAEPDIKVAGDAKLFLPSSGAIEVAYAATKLDGTPITEGVTWSLVDDGRVKSYAKIDAATGVLTVNAVALGETFKIKATDASGSAEFQVTTNSFSYSTDFEDGTIPSFITNGDSVTVETDGGNKYAPFKGNSWNKPGSAAIDLTNADFVAQVLTVEAKFRSAGIGDTSNVSYKNPTVPIQVNYDKTFMGNTYWNNATHKSWPVNVFMYAANTGEGTAKVLVQDYRNYTINGETGAHIDDSYRWKTAGTYSYTGTYTKNDASGTGGSFSAGFSFTDLKLVVKNDKIYVSIDGADAFEEDFISDVTDIETQEKVSVIGVPLTSIQFGTPIDDLEIYTGDKVAAFVGEGTYAPVAPSPSPTPTATATPAATATPGASATTSGLKITGDAKLFLPSEGAVEVQYKAENGDGTAVDSGIVWSLVDDGRVKTYAKIDAATGKLTINAVALGESFTIKAESANESKTFAVTTNSATFGTDFESETTGSVVSKATFGKISNIGEFSTPATALIEEGNGGKVVKGSTSGTSIHTLAVQPTDFVSNNYTFEAKVVFPEGVAWNYQTFLYIKYKDVVTVSGVSNGTGETRFGYYRSQNPEGGSNQIQLRQKGTITTYGQDAWTNWFDYTWGTYLPIKVVVKDNYLADVYVNGTKAMSDTKLYGHDAQSTSALYDEIDYFAFAAQMDDFELYTGTKVAAFVGEGTYAPVPTATPTPSPTPAATATPTATATPAASATPTATATPAASATPTATATPAASATPAPALAIVGDDVILPVERENGIMRVPYKLNDTGVTDVVWSVAAIEGGTLPAGVEIREDGGLLITGNKVKDKKFIVQAKNAAGEVLAEKEVRGIRTASGNANSDFYYWTDYTAHGFKMDFEMYDVGINNISRRMFGNAGWDDYLIQPGSKQASNASYAGNAGTVKTKADGDKYVSAFGQKTWDSTGSGLNVTLSASRYAGQTGIGGSWFGSGYASVATVEADFMIESATLTDKMDGSSEFSLFYGSDAGVNLSYKKVSDNEAVIYNCSNNSRAEMMRVPADTWFNVRIEKDHVAGTIDIYVDNKLMVNDFACPSGGITSFAVGAAIDNIYAYAGSLQAPTLPDSLPEALYYTTSRQQAVINVDNNVYLGIYPFPDKVSYFGVGVTAQGNKLYVPYGISNVTITSEDSLYGLNRVATISRSTITEGFDEGTSKTLPDMTGDILITFTADGPFSATLTTAGGSKVISATEDPSSSAKVMIAANTKTGTYKAIFNDKLIGEGALSSGAITGFSVTGGNPASLVVSSMNVTEPYALSPVIAGVAAVGQELTADYVYYSPWQGAKTGSTVTWYIANAADGAYAQVATGETWVPEQAHAGKYVKYSISVTDGKKTSSVVESAPVLIKDVYSVSLVGSTLTAEVQNVLSDADIYVAAALYNGNTLQKTVVNKISFSGSSYTWTTDASGCDGAKVSLFAASDLKPVAPYKTAGSVPSEIISESTTATEIYARDGKLYLSGVANTMATVLLYGHGADGSDVTVAYSDVYERSEGLADAGKLAYATIVTLDGTGHAVISLPAMSNGSYRLDFIPRSGDVVDYLFMMNPQAALTPAVMNLPGFANVLKLYSNKADSEVDTIYSLYASLSDGGKANVAKLLAGSGYEVREFDPAACLIRYFENTSFDQTQFNRLKAELEARSLDVAGVTLMQYDALPNKTGEVLLAKTWTNFSDLLSQLYDTAVLYGVYHVRNYMEADAFLKVLTDTVYPDSAYKTDICNLVGGKLYGSLAELKAAINGYTPIPGIGGGTVSGGSAGGMVSGGTIGGGAPTVQSGSSVNVKESSYSDVSPEHWADEAISYLSSINVLSGRPDGSFGPEDSITRAEFVKILCSAFELKSAERASFNDVPANAWYASYAAVAGGMGIVQGTEGNFMPDAQITREDAAVMLHRVLETLGEEFPESGAGVVDQDSISEYAQSAVAQLQAIGLINGMEDGKYYPKNTMTRAQCAQVITNALRR